MKKLLINLFLFTLFLFVSITVTLSTVGIETNKFNNLISEKASETKNIFLKLKTIKFKIDLREMSLFLETQYPEITYKNILIPIENAKVYIDFLSLFTTDTKIEKTKLILKELDITQLNKLSAMIKPSNFKSLINNKIKYGKIITEIEFFSNGQNPFENFIAKGSVKELKVELINNLYLKKQILIFLQIRMIF